MYVLYLYSDRKNTYSEKEMYQLEKNKRYKDKEHQTMRLGTIVIGRLHRFLPYNKSKVVK